MDAPPADSAIAQHSCDPTAKFGPPVAIPELMAINAGEPRLSPDELTIYFHRGGAQASLWSAHRNSLSEPFGQPALLDGPSSSSADYDPAITADELTLWFASTRVANEGEHVYLSTRSSPLAQFGPPGLAVAINAPSAHDSDLQPFPTADGKELWFASTRTPGQGARDIWRAVWTGNGFAPPVPVVELSSAADEIVPTLSADRLTVYFSSTRAAIGTKGGTEIWTSHRSVVDDGFPPPTLVDELNTAGDNCASWLSADNCRIYGVSSVGGTSHIYVATRPVAP